jgi:hypothetical protein
MAETCRRTVWVLPEGISFQGLAEESCYRTKFLSRARAVPAGRFGKFCAKESVSFTPTVPVVGPAKNVSGRTREVMAVQLAGAIPLHDAAVRDALNSALIVYL